MAAEEIMINDSVRVLAAKAYVGDIQKYQEPIKKCTDSIEFLKQKTYSIGSMKITDTKIQAPQGQQGAAYENNLIKLDKLRDSFNRNYFHWKCKILNPLISIGKINNLDYQYLLWFRYSSCKSWEDIQKGLECEDIYTIRDQALLALSYVMESEGKLQKYACGLL